jgi:ribosomal protein S18 acetylase RimI-like enzyme
MSNDLDFQSAGQVPLPELVNLMNHCFQGYLVKIHLDHAGFLNLIRVDSVDLPASLVVRSSGQNAGIALVSRRGWSSRLATMAIAQDFRGRRIGSAVVRHLLLAAAQRRDREFVLETIEQNAPAVRLYQTAGFVRMRRLTGYTAQTLEGFADPALEQIDPASVGKAVADWGVDNLPWQMAPQTLGALSPPNVAFKLGRAFALITDPSVSTIACRALVVEPESRRKGWATRLLRAMAAQYPGKTWRFSIIVPEEIPAAFFLGLGFQKDGLTQLQLCRPIDFAS